MASTASRAVLPEPNLVMLDEQYRMAAPIGTYVSQASYDGRLKNSPEMAALRSPLPWPFNRNLTWLTIRGREKKSGSGSLSNRAEIEAVGRVVRHLQRLGLGHLKDRIAEDGPWDQTLSGGEKQRVGIARALATKPKLLLIDEPAAGLNASEVDSLLDRILTTRQKGVSVVVVEHNMELVMNVADRVLVMDYGQHLFEGVPADALPPP